MKIADARRSALDASEVARSVSLPPILEVSQLNVYYGRAHVLQGVALTFGRGVYAVVGRNGMGKTTLCNAITGLVTAASGSVRLAGEEIMGLQPHAITGRGIGYVPQGRRVWPSLTVDEHLQLAAKTARRGDWTVDRIYSFFPRLAERRGNGGGQLSGGEQQMLAIGRALLFNPRLLVMDEPTEGLAPVIVEQVTRTLRQFAQEANIAVLLIEQNLGVAIEVADRIAVMVNGRIAHELTAKELSADVKLQQQLLGVRLSGRDSEAEDASVVSDDITEEEESHTNVIVVQRSNDTLGHARAESAQLSVGLTHRNAVNLGVRLESNRLSSDLANSEVAGTLEQPLAEALTIPTRHDARLYQVTASSGANRAAYVVGTFDTKGRDLKYIQQCLERLGLRTVTVDLSTSGQPSTESISPREVARYHPQGERAVFTNDRGSSVAGMAEAFEHFILTRRDLGGLISAGGSGGTSLATRAMRALPFGIPKVMVSTVASGDVRPYVGPSDITMMHSVTDVSGVNQISVLVLGNAAHALAGMIAYQISGYDRTKPAVGLTMFGVTTPCVQSTAKLLKDRFDCLVFHATGTGGQSFEKLAESGLFAGVLDLTTTEVCDEIVGGVFSAGPGRLDAFARRPIPYLGSCGALDMVNFRALDTVPSRFRNRTLYRHNDNVTLMRTSPDECRSIGIFIAEKLNRLEGPVRFLLPEGGVSALDAPGQPFWDPVADRVLFETIATRFRSGPHRRIVRTPLHLNDPAFAEFAVRQFDEILIEASALEGSKHALVF